MRKISFVLALLCLFSFSILVANDSGSSYDESLSAAGVGDSTISASESDSTTVTSDKEASEKSKSKTEEAKEEKSKEEENKEEENKEEENKGMATLPNGKAYVGVYSTLNLRDGIWGSVTAKMTNNEEVTITGRDGDWYKVSTSKGEGYVHARYIFDKKDARYKGNDPNDPTSSSSSSSSGSSSDVVINVSGDSVQGKVVNAAKQLVDKYSESGSFPYAPETNGGNLGCAQVVTTALKAAGVLNQTVLSCDETIDLLNNAGWKTVGVPPFQAGDVIFWETYRSGPSHVGIIMTSGNSATAMSNSSSQHKPRYHDANYQKIVKVMRKA